MAKAIVARAKARALKAAKGEKSVTEIEIEALANAVERKMKGEGRKVLASGELLDYIGPLGRGYAHIYKDELIDVEDILIQRGLLLSGHYSNQMEKGPEYLRKVSEVLGLGGKVTREVRKKAAQLAGKWVALDEIERYMKAESDLRQVKWFGWKRKEDRFEK